MFPSEGGETPPSKGKHHCTSSEGRRSTVEQEDGQSWVLGNTAELMSQQALQTPVLDFLLVLRDNRCLYCLSHD